MPVSQHTQHNRDAHIHANSPKISDLLASISGGQASGPAGPPKRKAEEDLKPVSKVARQCPAPPKLAQPSRPLDRPNALSKPANGNTVKPALAALKPMNGAHRVTKPAAPTRPSPVAPPSNSAPAVNKAPPKKGSYAEVLARAKKAQEAMGQVGRIQHKKVEKKEKEPAARADPRQPMRKPAGARAYQGTAKAGQRPGTNGAAMRNGTAVRDARGKPTGKPSMNERDEEHEKKVKKAAQATTGYTGTARPRPGASSKKDAAPRGGALLNRASHRPGASKSSRYGDDYDEELDDFIDYDDEEDDQGGPRYHYDSDGSSDMEAGLDDIDVEERQAERIARREDIEEERLERTLKAAKEDRKRKALEALAARKRR